MSRDSDRAEALRRDFVTALVEQTGMREVMAMPIADSLVAWFQKEYAGERLYIPQPTRQFDVLLIEASLRAGTPPHVVARTHGTSVRQLHRMFPGGLPKPHQAA